MPYNNCKLAICKFRNGGGAKWQGAKCLAFNKIIGQIHFEEDD